MKLSERMALKRAIVRAQRSARTDAERLEWIACASRQEIEEMLAHSTCDDVEDMRRFIDERIGRLMPEGKSDV